ncbi:NADP-dependent oxidoreductase domain-containing protein [Kockovaella imperatae]|uniref:NADP-dependent oxidoreductase domain-containing protein n=1 Tax=Kockovaella imperatae TaxID=4999 RepID=A0A1Y1U6S1_9TREE|nr:NADP-dependent oxidoreductase domain-containing protein [Kockovaella imperatae]ORX33739.1 NADP-dependent oxidoreductase domain-containing protein [Kockovaella imperatae]
MMEYVNLGKSGLKVSHLDALRVTLTSLWVSKLVLGCMTYGSGGEWMISDHDESIRQIKYAYDKGINAFDTANTYSAGESEVILGKFLKQHNIPRESVVILTKTFNTDGKLEDKGPAGWINQKGLSRKRIFASVDDSLKRLQLDYIDVLQCHRFDPETPVEETMQALHDVVQSGKVRYIGMSSCWAWQFQLMQTYAIHNRLTPFISMQNQHSALYREEEREMMPMLKHYGIGVIPWGPLAAGLLCRPPQERKATPRGDKGLPNDGRGTFPSELEIIARVEKVAKNRGVPMAEVAIAWSLQSEWVTAPIVGVRSTERLDELIKGLQCRLTEEEIKEIGEPYQPVKVRGHK